MATDEKSTKGDVVAEAKKRFERAKQAYSATRLLAVEDTRFAMGDSDNGWQWPDDIRNTRKLDKRVCLTVNMTAQHCNQIINNIRQNRPSVKVSPVDNFADKKTAEILGGLIRNIQVSSAADDAHDCAAEHSVYGGEGYWRIVTEYESDTSFDQIIKIKACPNPQLVYIDPDCKEIDKSDAQWGFVFEDITKEQFEREHPDIDPASWGDEARKAGWMTDTTFRRAEYFYCTYENDVACLLPDGRTELKSKLPPGTPCVKERPTEIKKWKWCKLVGGHDKPIDETDWLGEYLPIVAVVGKEINVNGDIVRKGIVRDLKDPARMVNFSYSETVQALALQNKVPYMAASESIEGYEQIWKQANLENRAYLPFNAYDDEGRQLPKPERQPPAVMPAAQVQLLQLSTEQMRAASGQQNANFGIKSEAQSGIGIQRLKVQGETATFHFPDNLSRALRYEAKVLIDLIQKYYDTARVVRILGLDGKEEQAHLQPDMEQPYHEAQDEQGEIQKIFNPQVGRYDVVIDTGPAYQTQRQEAFAALSEMGAKNPQLMQVAGDLIMRAADFPMADQLAERLAKTLPPGLQDEKPGQQQIPPEVEMHMQQSMQHMQQQEMMIQQLQQELQEAQRSVESKDADIKMAIIEAESEVEVARLNKEKDEDIAELNAYIEIMKAKMQPPPALAADVNQDLAEPEPVEEPPMPKLLRRRIQIQAPSGAIYSGTIEDDDMPQNMEPMQ
jgi:hypothetical protein